MHAAQTLALDRFRDLFVVLEDLIKRVADTDDPYIRVIRAKVRADLIDLEKDMTPIVVCAQGAGPSHPDWHQPALAVLAGAAAALTLLGEK